jgi:FKBP-type peptidyl-prolyl cis-trans isomerase
MRTLIITLCAAALLCGPATAQDDPNQPKLAPPNAAQPNAAPNAAPKADGLDTAEKKVSYAIGRNVGNNLAGQLKDIDTVSLLRGISDALNEVESPLTDEQIEAAFAEYQKVIEAKAAQAAEAGKKASEQFLAANKQKEGVKTTESGLQYQVIKEGTGAAPKATSIVKVHYHGTLPDGEVFDSSVERKEPATFPLNRVISGWTEGLQLMKVGGKYRFFIPPDLAYGERGSGPQIGPNQALVFDVELLEVIGDVPANPAPPGEPRPQSN